VEYSRGRPWKWQRLAQVSRRWRLVISLSTRRLDLQILCNSGASIKRTLASWGTLPLVVQYQVKSKTKSLPRNITIALRHPDRVREIDLGLTSTQAESILDAIKKPFQTLERIRITINDATSTGSSLFGNAFLGGSNTPCLRKIVLDGINFPFPEIKQVISSTNNLVELRLLGISKSAGYSADALFTALSASAAQLRRLEVDFHYPASLPNQSETSSPVQRVTFLSLSRLEFYGASEFLEEFVSRGDFPALRYIDIQLFNQVFFEIPQFCRAIPLSNAFDPPTEVAVGLGAKKTVVCFTQNRKGLTHVDVNYTLGTSCLRLDWQLSFAIDILNQLSPLLSGVGSLVIFKATSYIGDGLVTGEEDVDSTQWLELLQPFTHATKFNVAEKFVLVIVQALVMDDNATGVLPELTQLDLQMYRKSPAVVEAAEQFVAARRLSGRNIDLSDLGSGYS
jgi:hypothetical protein